MDGRLREYHNIFEAVQSFIHGHRAVVDLLFVYDTHQHKIGIQTMKIIDIQETSAFM